MSALNKYLFRFQKFATLRLTDQEEGPDATPRGGRAKPEITAIVARTSKPRRGMDISKPNSASMVITTFRIV